MDTYVRIKGFNDPVLFKFVTGLIVRWEIHLSSKPPTVNHVYDASPGWDTPYFVHAMCKSLQDMGPDELHKLTEEDSELEIWVKVIQLHHISRRLAIPRFVNCQSRFMVFFLLYSCESGLRLQDHFPSLAKSWKDICHNYLPGPEDLKVRERLSRLEDVYGFALRGCYPREERSIAANERMD